MARQEISEWVLFFENAASQYGVLPHFRKGLSAAFERHGIDCRVVDPASSDMEDLSYELLSSPPVCTLAFNGLLPDDKGRFIADLLKIPHIAIIVDHPNHFFPIAKSAYTVIATVDQNSCDYWRECQAPHVLFFPHAINKELAEEPVLSSGTRHYDIVMVASYIDYELIEVQWKSSFSQKGCNALHQAAQKVLNSVHQDHIGVLKEALMADPELYAEFNPRSMDLPSLMSELEYYIRGLDRVRLVESLPSFPIHIFGDEGAMKGWSKLKQKNKNLTFHGAIPYEQLPALFRDSKIVLNSSPTIKMGLHERLLCASACGSSVLTNQTFFLNSQFEPQSGIYGYRPPHYEAIEPQMRMILNDEKARIEAVCCAKQQVIQLHTWDKRAEQLINQLPPLFEKMGLEINPQTEL